MKLYKVIHELNSEYDDTTVKRHSVLEEAIKVYRKLKKKAKSHRTVYGRDLTSIEADTYHNNTIIQSVKGIDVKDELIGLLVKKKELYVKIK